MKPEAQLTVSGLVTLDKVKARYDTASAILKELQNIPPGELMPERELCRRTAGTDTGRFKRAVENNPDLCRERRVKLKLDEGEAKYFWGSAKDVKAASAMRDE